MRFRGVVPSWRRAGWPGARLLVLLAALAGLFAMHGMSDHGTMHHGSPETHTSTAPVNAPDMGPALHAMTDGHSVSATVSKVVGAAGGTVAALGAAAGDGAFDAGLHAAMGLCLAILVGAAVLALRRLRPWAFTLSRSLGDASQRVLPSRARAPDPPDLYVLSIQRC